MPTNPAPFPLNYQKVNGAAQLTWPAWQNQPFGKYVVVRAISNDPSRQPTLPVENNAVVGEVAASFNGADQTMFVQPLDGSQGVPIHTPYVAFRVAVYDTTDKLVGLSDTYVLHLSWSFKPSDQPDPPPPPPTTTTTAPTEEAAARSRS